MEFSLSIVILSCSGKQGEGEQTKDRETPPSRQASAFISLSEAGGYRHISEINPHSGCLGPSDLPQYKLDPLSWNKERLV